MSTYNHRMRLKRAACLIFIPNQPEDTRFELQRKSPFCTVQQRTPGVAESPSALVFVALEHQSIQPLPYIKQFYCSQKTHLLATSVYAFTYLIMDTIEMQNTWG